MFGTLVETLAEVTGCDRSALAAVLDEPAHPDQPADPDTLGAAGLLDRIAAKERLVQAVQASQLRDLEAFAARRVAEDRALGLRAELAGRSAPVEVAKALGVATMTADGRLRDASAAVHQHPRLLSLLGTGRVSTGGLGRVIDTTRVLEPAQQRRVDEQVAAEAQRRAMTPGELGRAAARRVLQIDPEAADKRAARARRRRDVRLCDPVDGTAQIIATLRAEDALAVHTRLDRTARGRRQSGDERPLDTLRADLFVEALAGRSMVTTGPGQKPPVWRSTDGRPPWTLTSPPPVAPDASVPEPPADDPAWDTYSEYPTPRHCPHHPIPTPSDLPEPDESPPRRLPTDVEVQVVLQMSTALGLDRDPGLLRGYGAIPADVIADIVDSAELSGARTTLRALFCDPLDGRLVAMDSKARRFTGGLRQFALYRDQNDRLTGGTIRDLDHIIDHDRGGPTTAANAQGLARRTHTLKDHPAIRAQTLTPNPQRDGLDHYRTHAPDVRWTMPTGHHYDSAPPPVLGYGSDPAEAEPPPDWDALIAAILAEGQLDSPPV